MRKLEHVYYFISLVYYFISFVYYFISFVYYFTSYVLSRKEVLTIILYYIIFII